MNINEINEYFDNGECPPMIILNVKQEPSFILNEEMKILHNIVFAPQQEDFSEILKKFPILNSNHKLNERQENTSTFKQQ